jgi:hypothetical protein
MFLQFQIRKMFDTVTLTFVIFSSESLFAYLFKAALCRLFIRTKQSEPNYPVIFYQC